ncbi:MAG: bi-domain-containing oxidoreductase [Lewinellaceae bacterium]|nr:bi-domain-containing oxidoreductase [Lewinellaceae bacterium]
MKQIIQDLKTGQTLLEELPAPRVQPGMVLIRTHRSLVSLGTERMLVEFGRAGWLAKARQQPEKVRQVLDKVRTDGLAPTVEAVRRKLAEPIPLGYCNAGEVVAVGAGVDNFRVGDRVASNGPHAELVCVPKNLVARIPDGVSYDEAAFTVIGAIGLQGLRLLAPTFGETVVVTGLGLIGLIAAQLLHANGCRVVGLDFDEEKVALAKSWGIQAFNVSGDADPVPLVQQHTNGIGADGVLITASTKSNEVIRQAAQMSRKRGRIVLVGVVGLDLQRADFYEKELTFQVSCSYGPGRYDPGYEEKGQDYPIGFVRWTEQRNFEAVLQAIAAGRLDVKPLITEVVGLEDFEKVYGDMRQSGAIASILKYAATASPDDTSINLLPTLTLSASATSDFPLRTSDFQLGIIGAGNFTGATLLPALKKAGASIKAIASSKGLSGTTLAKKFSIAQSTTDYHAILADPEIDSVILTTRHDAHARQATQALAAGKHVFVEKPLALNHPELEAIREAYLANDKTLTVGFNRRYSPFTEAARELLGEQPGPMHVFATANAGQLPPNHWTQDMETGGGRIIGEACHFIDLITFLTGSLVDSVAMNALGAHPAENTDNASILLRYRNGANGVINYVANGNNAYPKERIEIHYQGKTIVIDNFRRADFFGYNRRRLKGRQDKGHGRQFELWLERLKAGGPALISWEELENTALASFAALESLRGGAWVGVNR